MKFHPVFEGKQQHDRLCYSSYGVVRENRKRPTADARESESMIGRPKGRKGNRPWTSKTGFERSVTGHDEAITMRMADKRCMYE